MGALNQYTYTDNQPTNFIDPSGLYKIHPSLLVRARESSSAPFSNIAGFITKCIARVIEVVQATVESKGKLLWQPSHDPQLPPPGPAFVAIFKYLDDKIHPEFTIGYRDYPGVLGVAHPGPKYAEDRGKYGSIAFGPDLVRSWEKSGCDDKSVDSCAENVIHEITHWHLRDIKFPGNMWNENLYIDSAITRLLVFPSRKQ